MLWRQWMYYSHNEVYSTSIVFLLVPEAIFDCLHATSPNDGGVSHRSMSQQKRYWKQSPTTEQVTSSFTDLLKPHINYNWQRHILAWNVWSHAKFGWTPLHWPYKSNLAAWPAFCEEIPLNIDGLTQFEWECHPLMGVMGDACSLI